MLEPGVLSHKAFLLLFLQFTYVTYQTRKLGKLKEWHTECMTNPTYVLVHFVNWDITHKVVHCVAWSSGSATNEYFQGIPKSLQEARSRMQTLLTWMFQLSPSISHIFFLQCGVRYEHMWHYMYHRHVE